MSVLDGKIAIVTGTSRGVGVGIAHELLRAGATVDRLLAFAAGRHPGYRRRLGGRAPRKRSAIKAITARSTPSSPTSWPPTAGSTSW